MNFKITAEQEQAIQLAQQGNSFKIIAYAGSGKTTTLQLISQALQPKRGIYLAFNKAIAQAAQAKFPNTVKCQTFHSLAYRSVSRQLTDKLNLPRYSPSALASELHLKAMPIKRLIDGRYEQAVLTPARQASLISNALSYFCSTHAKHPAPRHIQLPNWMHPTEAEQLQQYLYPLLEKRWLDALNPAHQAGIGHDIYLKSWALSNPVIPTEFILFDEAQDSDPLMLGILLGQKHTQVVYVGDPYQQIYQWRGAVNAMQQLPLAETRLTHSFRFGEQIGQCANIILRQLGENTPLQASSHIASSLSKSPSPQSPNAILTRTNAHAMTLMMMGLIKGHKVALQADIDRLKRFVNASEQLQQGKTSQELPELSWFNNWNDVQEYSETQEGNDMRPLIKLLDEHGCNALKTALSKMSQVQDADYVISTAHKAKGLEWSKVHLESDYNFRVVKGEPQIEEDELRLLYVAITRAKNHLNVFHLLPLLEAIKSKQADKEKNTSTKTLKVGTSS